MTAHQADGESRGSVCGPCRIGECGHCDGNIDLQVGAWRAVRLIRCSHHCQRGHVRQVKR
jgi:hypothetical protein